MRKALVGLCGLLVGCGSTSDGGTNPTPVATEALFEVPGDAELKGDTFFNAPWPNDLRAREGVPVYEGFVNPRDIPILAEYIQAADTLNVRGFSGIASGYVRFSAAIDPSSLPQTPLEALDEGASVQLVNIDPESADYGARMRISLRYREQEGVYWPSNTLAFMPTLGFPLSPSTRYALIVTNKVLAADGSKILPSAGLTKLLTGDTSTEGLRAAEPTMKPALAALEELGIRASSLLNLAVFTTNDPSKDLFTVRDHLRSEVPVPTMDPAAWELKDSGDSHDEYVGEYGPSPNYQIGTVPYASYGDGGGFVIEDGAPQIQELFDLRFSLSVPKADKCPMPADGYPIVLYAHGTGGNYRTYVSENLAEDLGERCIAIMGVDQIFHGTRPGGGDTGLSEMLFFNFQNVIAARTNAQQSAIDEVQRARLFTEAYATIPSDVSGTGTEIRFDPDKVLFFGHSQGGMNGPLYLASDDSSRGGILSGSSSVVTITLLEKTKPTPSVAGLVESLFLGLSSDEAEELDEFHPALALAQSLVDPVDAINYARYTVGAPRAEFAAKSVYMTEGVGPDGIGDSYAPPHGTEVQAIAMGLPLALPAQRDIAESAWGGPTPISIPAEGVSGNLASGKASGVLAQWQPTESDGHFVVFDVKPARAQALQFLVNLANDKVGRVPAVSAE